MTLHRVLGVLAAVLGLTTAGWGQGPGAGDEGPPDGLTLDAAIDLLVVSNDGLRARSREIPEARADELTAGLRNAPAIFLSGDQLPYGRYSPQRPGASEYEVSPALNVDYSGKRRAHMNQTALATRQVEARYQNAVREEIDHLHDAFVAVLEAREAERAAREHLDTLDALIAKARQAGRSEDELAAAAVQRFHAATAVGEAVGRLLQARRRLGALLALPPERADCLEVCGSLHVAVPPLPPAEELTALAVASRPDLAAQRLAVETDRAGIRVAQAETFDDAIVFVSPYEVQNFSPEGKRPATDWAAGAATTLPVLDRNQGDLVRARVTVRQTQIELCGLERRVANEVQQARAEYEAAAESVRRYEQAGLPAIRRYRDEKVSGYAAGREEIDSVLEAQQMYHEETGRYREALARRRRGMLHVNTVVGRRLVP